MCYGVKSGPYPSSGRAREIVLLSVQKKRDGQSSQAKLLLDLLALGST